MCRRTTLELSRLDADTIVVLTTSAASASEVEKYLIVCCRDADHETKGTGVGSRREEEKTMRQRYTCEGRR